MTEHAGTSNDFHFRGCVSPLLLADERINSRLHTLCSLSSTHLYALKFKAESCLLVSLLSWGFLTSV